MGIVVAGCYAAWARTKIAAGGVLRGSAGGTQTSNASQNSP
jgi:hypothetical protein